MIKAVLVSALDGDFRRSHETVSVHTEEIDGTWYVFQCGPRYSNVHKVTEYDAEGLERLRAKAQPTTPTQTP